MPLTDEFVHVTSSASSIEYTDDISIYHCDACGVVQNPADFDYESYYSDYKYSSGHSVFVQNFMSAYASAAISIFEDVNGRKPTNVLEAGSGDGEQLKCFVLQGVSEVLGVEPSDYLARVASSHGIGTQVSLFDTDFVNNVVEKYDICISSYTFDHVRDPADYLSAAHQVLNDGGLLCIEIHDLDTIKKRGEFCLFEHEHTIYLDQKTATAVLKASGFDVIAVNPVPSEQCRGNSLIVMAKKSNSSSAIKGPLIEGGGLLKSELYDLQARIDLTIAKLDHWISSLPENERLVGFGAGGRGIMTLAAIKHHSKFSALFDTNYQSDLLLTPKTRVPVFGPDRWADFADSHCLVFSFGYFDEITDSLRLAGFDAKNIRSLLSFYE
jgi:SAM-dependent methyltransferase